MPKAERNPSLSCGRTLRTIAALLLAVLALGTASSWAGEFETANQAYDQGKFSEAKGGYEKLLESGSGSANIYYNLGNTDFRLGSAGRAILNYERTLALNPHHPEARANLKLLRDQNGAKLLPRTWNSRVAALLTPQVWTMVASVTGWIFAFGIVWIVISRRDDNFGLWTFSLASALVCAVALVSIWSIAKDQTLAVITAKQTEARLAPAESAGVAEALPAGSQVRVLSERGEWIYCELPGLGRGWIPDGAVERVRPVKS
ncbi:MAG: tetratricopeptide repeat protein [Chthoniobacter sp.]|uniref:tetratricopeptide repeat protein n=1 Tax=Chthoniobacter sp. TaxID=2510640 RepID=UPI0032A20A9B